MSCVKRELKVHPADQGEMSNRVEYKRVLFQMDEDLEKVIGIVKMYQSRYGELE